MQALRVTVVLRVTVACPQIEQVPTLLIYSHLPSMHLLDIEISPLTTTSYCSKTGESPLFSHCSDFPILFNETAESELITSDTDPGGGAWGRTPSSFWFTIQNKEDCSVQSRKFNSLEVSCSV